MRILLYCPLNPVSPRLYARTLRSIFGLDWEGPLEVVFGRDDHMSTDRDAGYDNLTSKHNRAREMALSGGFDALFLVEADMIIPVDALTRLVAVDADVAYGLYCSRHSNQWLAFTTVGKHTGRSIDQDRAFCASHWGKVIPTAGAGLGVTLIHRAVLEAVPFRRGGPNADDWYHAIDCQARSYTQAHDLGVVCGHILPGGDVLWPTLQGEELYKIEVEQ